MRKLFHVLLSLMIVYASTTSAYAASPAGWVVTKAVSSGSRVVVNATNSGYKSAINIPPNLAKITKFAMKGANAIGLIQIATDFLGDGVDFVLDPDNNTIKYKVVTGGDFANNNGVTGAWTVGSIRSSSAANAFSRHMASIGRQSSPVTCEPINSIMVNCAVKRPDGSYIGSGQVMFDAGRPSDTVVLNKVLPLSDMSVAIANAAKTNANAQKILQDVALAAVAAGDYDMDFLSGAVPLSDNKPLVPAIPGNQIGDIDTGVTGGDVGAAAADADAAYEAARKAADAAKNAAKDAADDARAANDRAKDLINQAVDQAIKDAAAVAAKDAAAVADDAKVVADEADIVEKQKGKEKAKADKKVAERGLEDVKDIAENALPDVKDKALEDVKEAEKALEKANEAVEAAEKALERAKAEAAKPFELPAFCSWAAPVCDAIEWLKRDPSEVAPLPVDVGSVAPDNSASDFDVSYLNFGGQCPVLPSYSINIMGVSISDSFDMTPLCNLAVVIRPAIIAMAYFIGLGIIASSIRGS